VDWTVDGVLEVVVGAAMIRVSNLARVGS